jgi:hypothetical protein
VAVVGHGAPSGCVVGPGTRMPHTGATLGPAGERHITRKW